MSPPAMPPLETDRLIIRPFAASDLDDVYRIIDCDCFGQRNPDDEEAKQRRRAWLDWNIAGEHQQASLGHPPYGERAITRKTDGRMVGICGLVPSFGPFRRVIDGYDECPTNSPEIGLFYAVAREHRRQGYAAEAARALVQFAFERLNVDRVVATTESDNEASMAVMRQLGFTIHRNPRGEGPQVIGFRTTYSWDATITRKFDQSSLSCRSATAADVPLLARMNQQLIEDEGSRNPLSLAELEARMEGWIDGDWDAVIIEQNGEPVGYVLFQLRSDEYRPADTTADVRQFFIEREYRSRGIGRRAFGIVAETYFPDLSAVVLDVLETNPRARRFWETLGFEPYCTTMKFKP
jgi:[ribosomal protein S5]-alanine N-acetyltransferase